MFMRIKELVLEILSEILIYFRFTTLQSLEKLTFNNNKSQCVIKGLVISPRMHFMSFKEILTLVQGVIEYL